MGIFTAELLEELKSKFRSSMLYDGYDPEEDAGYFQEFLVEEIDSLRDELDALKAKLRELRSNRDSPYLTR